LIPEEEKEPRVKHIASGNFVIPRLENVFDPGCITIDTVGIAAVSHSIKLGKIVATVHKCNTALI